MKIFCKVAQSSSFSLRLLISSRATLVLSNLNHMHIVDTTTTTFGSFPLDMGQTLSAWWLMCDMSLVDSVQYPAYSFPRHRNYLPTGTKLPLFWPSEWLKEQWGLSYVDIFRGGPFRLCMRYTDHAVWEEMVWLLPGCTSSVHKQRTSWLSPGSFTPIKIHTFS